MANSESKPNLGQRAIRAIEDHPVLTVARGGAILAGGAGLSAVFGSDIPFKIVVIGESAVVVGVALHDLPSQVREWLNGPTKNR